jgi:hypothetical protein
VKEKGYCTIEILDPRDRGTVVCIWNDPFILSFFIALELQNSLKKHSI